MTEPSRDAPGFLADERERELSLDVSPLVLDRFLPLRNNFFKLPPRERVFLMLGEFGADRETSMSSEN